MRSRPIEGYRDSLADYSNCGLYRYFLQIVWNDALPVLMFVMLNPSQASQGDRDGTVTRCLNRASTRRQEGEPPYGGVFVTNIFPFITPDTQCLKDEDDKFGLEDNNGIIERHARHPNTAKIVCAWGANGSDNLLSEHATNMKVMLNRVARDKLNFFELTPTTHQPKHPLPLDYDDIFEPWRF